MKNIFDHTPPRATRKNHLRWFLWSLLFLSSPLWAQWQGPPPSSLFSLMDAGNSLTLSFSKTDEEGGFDIFSSHDLFGDEIVLDADWKHSQRLPQGRVQFESGNFRCRAGYRELPLQGYDLTKFPIDRTHLIEPLALRAEEESWQGEAHCSLPAPIVPGLRFLMGGEGRSFKNRALIAANENEERWSYNWQAIRLGSGLSYTSSGAEHEPSWGAYTFFYARPLHLGAVKGSYKMKGKQIDPNQGLVDVSDQKSFWSKSEGMGERLEAGLRARPFQPLTLDLRLGLEGWLSTDEREAYGKRLTLKDEEITGPEDPLFGLPPFLYDDRHSSLDWNLNGRVEVMQGLTVGGSWFGQKVNRLTSDDSPFFWPDLKRGVGLDLGLFLGQPAKEQSGRKGIAINFGLDWEKAFLKSRTITYRKSSQETALTPGQESSRRWSLDLSWHF